MSEFGLLIGYPFNLSNVGFFYSNRLTERDAGAACINWNMFILSVKYLHQNILGSY